MEQCNDVIIIVMPMVMIKRRTRDVREKVNKHRIEGERAKVKATGFIVERREHKFINLIAILNTILLHSYTILLAFNCL